MGPPCFRKIKAMVHAHHLAIIHAGSYSRSTCIYYGHGTSMYYGNEQSIYRSRNICILRMAHVTSLLRRNVGWWSAPRQPGRCEGRRPNDAVSHRFTPGGEGQGFGLWRRPCPRGAMGAGRVLFFCFFTCSFFSVSGTIYPRAQVPYFLANQWVCSFWPKSERNRVWGYLTLNSKCSRSHKTIFVVLGLTLKTSIGWKVLQAIYVCAKQIQFWFANHARATRFYVFRCVSLVWRVKSGRFMYFEVFLCFFIKSWKILIFANFLGNS